MRKTTRRETASPPRTMAAPMPIKEHEVVGLLPALATASESRKHAGMSWQRGAMTMMAEIVGTGVLGLAYAGARVGWALAFAFLCFFGLCSLFSSLLLAAVRKEHGDVDSYMKAAGKFCGPRAERWTAHAINWNWLLVLPYFLMASAHALSVAFWWKDGVCYYEWALLSVACVALPAQIRSLEALSTLTAASVGAIGVVLVLTAASLILEGREVDGEPSVWLPPPDMSVWDCFDSVSMMTFAYQGQSMLLEIADEMEDPRDFGKAVKVSCGSLVGLYACALAVGYYYRGAAVPSFLPDALDDSPLKTLVGVLLYFHIVVTYLVNNQPLTKKVCDALWPRKGDEAAEVSARQWAGVTGAFLAWSYLIANLIPWFSDFQNVMGSMLGAPVMFGFPVAFYVLDPKQSSWKGSKATQAALLLVGGVVLPLTWVIGTVAAFVGLASDWSSSGGVFACQPSGYA